MRTRRSVRRVQRRRCRLVVSSPALVPHGGSVMSFDPAPGPTRGPHTTGGRSSQQRRQQETQPAEQRDGRGSDPAIGQEFATPPGRNLPTNPHAEERGDGQGRPGGRAALAPQQGGGKNECERAEPTQNQRSGQDPAAWAAPRYHHFAIFSCGAPTAPSPSVLRLSRKPNRWVLPFPVLIGRFQPACPTTTEDTLMHHGVIRGEWGIRHQGHGSRSPGQRRQTGRSASAR